MATTTTQAVLIAGSNLEVEDPDAPGTYYDLGEVLNVGTIGEPGTFVDVTPLDVTTKSRLYIGGLKDPPENTLTYNWRRNDTNQELLRGWALALRSVRFRITTAHGYVVQALVSLSGFSFEMTDANAQFIATVNYRASEAWSYTVPT